jgi:hypothetical protein
VGRSRIGAWRNGNVLVLHTNVEGSIPSVPTIHNYKGPKGVSCSLGASPYFNIK